MNANAVGATGGSQPHDNLPPYIVLTFYIAMEGIFPSRN
jgi:microcystin-dependent protein